MHKFNDELLGCNWMGGREWKGGRKEGRSRDNPELVIWWDWGEQISLENEGRK